VMTGSIDRVEAIYVGSNEDAVVYDGRAFNYDDCVLYGVQYR
jgi:hypothetical protein